MLVDVARGPAQTPIIQGSEFFNYLRRYSKFNDGGRADVQHACGIANAAGIQGHIDNLLLHLRGLPREGILQEKRPPASQVALPASVPLLAFRDHAMAHNIRPVAVGTMQHLRNHGIPIQSWSLSYS